MRYYIVQNHKSAVGFFLQKKHEPGASVCVCCSYMCTLTWPCVQVFDCQLFNAVSYGAAFSITL